jgi:hypothetical protein
MAKNSITDYSKTAASNTDIQSVDIAEGCLPSGINNAIREIMADLADMNDGTVTLTSPAVGSIGVTGNITVGGTVDGRDVATDGTKLDGVEASADVTDTTNVTAAGAAMLTGATFTGSITAPDATFNGTTAVKLPAGTDAQRPTGVNGMLRYNSDDAQFEGYADGEWGAIAGGGETSFLLYSYTATSGQTTFSGSDDNSATLAYTASNIIVTLNGITLENGTDYTASNGTSIVLTVGAAAGDELNVIAFKSFTVSDTVAASTGGTFNGNVAVNGDLTVDTDTLYVDSTNNKVGIGTSLPDATGLHVHTGSAGTLTPNSAADDLVVESNGNAGITIASPDANYSGIIFSSPTDTTGSIIEYNQSGATFDIGTATSGGVLRLRSGNFSEAMRIDSSGNVIVGGTTAFGAGTTTINQSGLVEASRSGNKAGRFNRETNDGAIVQFAKDGTTVGSIGTWGGGLYIGSPAASDAYLYFANNYVAPSTTSGFRNNAIDLGNGSARFDDVYATNGTIQTSDQNEKQQISSLTDAEITAAKAISTLFKTFKWNDKVEAKGDAARTHTGVIAQDVQQAMTGAGLDAGDYAFFISTTWWETQTEVPAVEADEENGIEAADAYTRTDTYETAEEAPEGATERTRLGIRYPELLAFVGAATEQRLANIETRLTALEAE